MKTISHYMTLGVMVLESNILLLEAIVLMRKKHISSILLQKNGDKQMTADEKTEDKGKGVQTGAADYITRSINAPEVRARVAADLKMRQTEGARVAADTHLNVFAARFKENAKCTQTIEKIKKELGKIKVILEQIQQLDQVKQTDYVGGAGMIELEGV